MLRVKIGPKIDQRYDQVVVQQGYVMLVDSARPSMQ